MRWLLPVLLAAGTAAADPPKLPAPADQPPSQKARDESWQLDVGCTDRDCRADWVRAATIDPSNIDVRSRLADDYYRRGDRAAALAVMDQLKASACRDCLRALIAVRLRAWAGDTEFAEQVTRGARGRRSKYSVAAATVISALVAGNWTKLAPFVSKKGVQWDPDAGVLTPVQIRDLLAEVRGERATIRASGLTTCEGDCCYEIWDELGGDEPQYLEGMCFAPGPALIETSWDSLR
ncbi:MAG TPA: hypothetical protein VMJ10_08480 [Kofleriaceae bacterium]|nr:hypothetical protein [Kofleriaceae bacterium]